MHGFRHTHCSLLFEADLAVKDVQARLGHSDMQTTLNIYTDVTEDSKDKSAELFQAYINFQVRSTDLSKSRKIKKA